MDKDKKGELALFWTYYVDIKPLIVCECFMLCEISTPMVMYYVVFLYGTPHIQDRQAIWNEIATTCLEKYSIIILIGEFNQLEFQEQKLGGKHEIIGAQIFSNWRVLYGLTEIPVHGYPLYMDK